MSGIDLINKNNFTFNKKYGQNFIFDKNLLGAIIKDSGITKDDEVLEIGAGAGTLTKIIAQNAKSVVSYEIDKNLEPVLKENWRECGNSAVVFSDALKLPIADIEKHFTGDYKIVANLPYYITTPLIMKFVKQTNRVKSLSIMVQKEVGERLTAKNTDAQYGSISVILDFYGDVKILRQVSRKMFVPVPNVDSCVVQISINKKKYDCNAEIFESVVKSAFSNKRKTLVNNISKDFNLSKDVIFATLKELNISCDIRGDALSTKDFVEITKKLTK